MKIDQSQEPDYDVVKITYIGFVDPYAVEGMLILTADNGKEFHMRAFSGEVAKHIASFSEESKNSVPTIYKMVEEICEENELMLVKVKIYESGEVLRANLYFTGKKDLVLRNYRASDGLALATFYKIPILVRKNLLKEKMDA
jgi:bifunctional DNase/RNase